MSVRRVKAGTVDVSVVLRIVDSVDGTPEPGVVFNTAGIDLWYRREGAAVTSITEVTLAALTTAHTDGGFLTISHGWYRLDLPDAACAAGASGVQIGGTVTGMVVYGPYIELVVNDEADIYARLGAPAGASLAADIAAIEAQTDDIGAAGAGLTALGDTRIANLDAAVSSRLATAGYTAPPTAAVVADAVWDEDATGHQTQGTYGQAIGDPGADPETIYKAVITDGAGFTVTDYAINLSARLPAALVSGRMDSSVGAIASGPVDTILDDQIGDSTITVRQALKLLVATLGGKLSGAGTTTVTIRNAADTADVVVATVDASGNRSAVTLTL